LYFCNFAIVFSCVGEKSILPEGGHDHEVEYDAGDGEHHLGDDEDPTVVHRLRHVVPQEVHHGRHYARPAEHQSPK